MKSQLATNLSYSRFGKARTNFFRNIITSSNKIERLTNANRAEVLAFLRQRPVHTVVMTSWIIDNGLENELNRGKFYGFRTGDGKLEGVALIGHTTLIEAFSDEALMAFAEKAKKSETKIHVMMSESNAIEDFWNHFADGDIKPKMVCTEKLFEMSFPVAVREHVPSLRLAQESDLNEIAVAHAEVMVSECGINPLERDDVDKYFERIRRRIQQGRIWVVFENEKLVFKADIISQTADVSYLEGVYVNPEMRGKGIAANCLSQLSRTLLNEVKSVCLLSNVDFKHAHRAFFKAGFKSKDYCQTIFM